ncbi:hypothetical protein L208DRAFT_1397629 [Tricholoma matsutake]|nr:hypothetical protein L208DRAFT_1397629 [Tricholoma matsutake 945]
MHTLPRVIFSLLLFVRFGCLIIIAVHTRYSSNWYQFIGRILGKVFPWTIYSNIKPCISLGDHVLASTCMGIFHSLGYSYYMRSGI